jgi:hypothetical protein
MIDSGDWRHCQYTFKMEKVILKPFLSGRYVVDINWI